MKSLCLKTNNKYMIDYLLEEFSNLELDSVYLSNSTFKLYENLIVHYTGDNPTSFIKLASDILTRCILFFYEKKIAKSLLDYHYFYFSEEEKTEILNDCIDLLHFDFELQEDCYQEIYDSIFLYLVEHHSMIIQGFVNFRLKGYFKLIDDTMELCVNNFLIEKEYYEFINLLHLYVNSKEANKDLVHLVYVNKESILMDTYKNIIPTNDQVFTATYLSDISFSSNDYCLNTLLNLLPNKIIIHLVDQTDDEFINTLKLIFEQRISICNDCDICRVYRLTNNVLV